MGININQKYLNMDGKINIKDDRYPKRLKEINDPPENLYYKGKWDKSLFENCLAVVGSRKMTRYGEKICTKLVTAAVSGGITIVSGFMYGMDATAHRAAVKAGGKTIAVMPCGIEKIHPGYQKKLYYQIIRKSGLIISEMKGKKGPHKWTYPKRNRIVAGLSQATLVVQAARKSGSLITADYAKKFNRKLLTVPGPLTSSVSMGVADLIKSGEAEVVIEPKDILKVFKKKQSVIDFEEEKGIKGKDDLEKRIIKQLEIDPMEADELSARLEVPIKKLGVKLSMMRMSNSIEQKGNKYYLSD